MEKTIEDDIFGEGKKRKKGINSPNKGGDNERELCKALSIWTGGKEFVRVPRSGGLRWKETQNICGDVICTDTDYDFRFSIETKHLKRIDVLDGVVDTFNNKKEKGNKGSIKAIWAQCVRDAARSDKIPLAAVRQNGMQAGTWMLFLPFSPYLNIFKIYYQLIPNVVIENDNMAIVGYDSSRLFSIPYYDILTTFNQIKKSKK